MVGWRGRDARRARRQVLAGGGLSIFLAASRRGGGGEGLCEEKRVHVSEVLPVGGAVVFMREEGSRRGGLDLKLPGRRVDYCVSGAITVRETVAGGWACSCGDWLQCGQVPCATPRSGWGHIAALATRLQNKGTRDQRGYRLLSRLHISQTALELTASLPMSLLSAFFRSGRARCTDTSRQLWPN